MIDQVTGEILDHVESQISQWPRYLAVDPEKELALRAQLAGKIAKVYRLFAGVEKAEKNSHFNYKFASAEKIFAGAREAMAEAGLALLPMMGQGIEVPIIEGNKRKGAYLQLSFEMVLVDTETGYSLPIPWRGEVNETGDKAIAKAAVSALKYFLRTFFLLPLEGPEDDADSGQGGERPAAGRARGQSGRPAPAAAPVTVSAEAQWFKGAGGTADQMEQLKAVGNALGLKAADLIREARASGAETVEAVMTEAENRRLRSAAMTAQAPLNSVGVDALHHHKILTTDLEGLAGELGITQTAIAELAHAVTERLPGWAELPRDEFVKQIKVEAVKGGAN